MTTSMVTRHSGPCPHDACKGAWTSALRIWRNSSYELASCRFPTSPREAELPGKLHRTTARVENSVLSERANCWLSEQLPLCESTGASSLLRAPGDVQGRSTDPSPASCGGTEVQTPAPPRVKCPPKVRGVWPTAGSAEGPTDIARAAPKPCLLDSERWRLDHQNKESSGRLCGASF